MKFGLGFGLNSGGNGGASLLSGDVEAWLMGDSITKQNMQGSKAPVGYITGVGLANPGTVTQATNLLANSDKVFYHSLLGTVELNDTVRQVAASGAGDPTYTLTDSLAAATALLSSSGQAFAIDNCTLGNTQIGYIHWANQYFGQRLTYKVKQNRGITGEKSAELDARKAISFPASILGAKKIAVILIGTNDAANGVAVATYSAYLDSLVAFFLTTRGFDYVIIGTPPPKDNDTSGAKDLKDSYVANIRARIGTNPKVKIWDFYDDVTNLATRSWKTGYGRADVTHPAALGAQAMGAKLADVFATILSAPSAFSVSGSNLLANPTMTGTGGSATGATNNGTATGYAATFAGSAAAAGTTMSKSAGGAQLIDFSFGAGTGDNSIFYSATVAAASLVDGQFYQARAVMNLKSYTGTGAFREMALTLRSNTALLSTDGGVVSGTPNSESDNNPATTVARHVLIPGQFATPAMQFKTGMTGLTVRGSFRFNSTLALAGQIEIPYMTLEPVSSPY